VVNACEPLASVEGLLEQLMVEGLILTTDTWCPVEVDKLLILVLDEPGDNDVTLAADFATASDVMPLAANSSLTRDKYAASG